MTNGESRQQRRTRERAEAGFRERAWSLTKAEIEDRIVAEVDTAARAVIGAGYYQAATAAVGDSLEHAGHTMVELAAIAGEALIRLARARNEDPQATVHWVRTTEWDRAS
jgi:hypothetical protein